MNKHVFSGRRVPVAFVAGIVSAVAWCSMAAPGNTLIAQPKAGRFFTPPLSTRLPEATAALPVFGTITWETTLLPWVAAGPNEGISGVGMVSIDGAIYVVGGFIPGGDETEDKKSRRTSRWLWRYEPDTDSWTRLPDAPLRREYTRAIAAGKTLVLVGGACQYKGEDPPYRVHGECAVIDPGADTPAWESFSSLNVPRTHTGVGYVGNHLVVVGGNEYAFEENGYSHKTIRATTEIFDLSNPELGWQVKTPIPESGRGWASSFTVHDKLYLLGGITWDAKNNVVATQESLAYDPEADRWQQLAPPPLPISGWEGACYRDRYALLVGGVVRPEPGTSAEMVWSDLLWAYDIKEDQWLRVHGKLPPGAVFNDPGVVVIGDTIYVLGAEGPHGSHYNYFLKGTITVVD